MSLTEARRRQALEAEARRLGVDPTTLEMSEAVGTDLVQDLVNDFRAGPSQPSSMLTAKPAEPKPAQSVERPLEPPPGIKIIDQLCDAQDALDRRDLAKRLRGD